MKAKAAKSIWIMSFELDRIEELCNDRGWSHYRLAKEMEISPNSIGNLFRRTTVPSIPTLRHMVSPWESFTVQTAARRS